MISNLPQPTVTDSSTSVKHFFDNFFVHEVTFPSNQIDATIAYFLKRGFDIDSARSTAIVLLNQARIDNVNVMSLLDTMRSFTDVQLSQMVTQVLNSNRVKTSILGYHIESRMNEYDTRNLLI